MLPLPELARLLTNHHLVAEMAVDWESSAHALECSGNVRLGDDCAAIPNPASPGHLLFAAEEMLESFVEDDPWFAGYSLVMLNLSDIAAMGGRPVALTDIRWSSSDEIPLPIWQGMQEAAMAYGVPIVGSHTTHLALGKDALGAAILGHAGDRLITSFDAKPGDHLVIAVDLHGSYRDDKPLWNSSTSTPPARLRADLELLPSLAEKGLCRAGRNISKGGIIGTLAMVCNYSQVGAVLDLEDVPCPMEVEFAQWLISLLSYGYLLAIPPEDLEGTLSHFTATRITCRAIGRFTEELGITLTADGAAVKLAFGQPCVHAASDVLDSGEAMIEQQLHRLSGSTTGLAVDKNFPVTRQTA